MLASWRRKQQLCVQLHGCLHDRFESDSVTSPWLALRPRVKKASAGQFQMQWASWWILKLCAAPRMNCLAPCRLPCAEPCNLLPFISDWGRRRGIGSGERQTFSNQSSSSLSPSQFKLDQSPHSHVFFFAKLGRQTPQRED